MGCNGGLPSCAPTSWPPSCLTPIMGSQGSISACPEEGGLCRAFPPSPSLLPIPNSRQARGAPVFPWKYGDVQSPLADLHPTSNKAQTVSTPTPRWWGAGWVPLAPACPWPASVTMATQSLAVGTVGLLGVLPVWVTEGGKGGQGQMAAALLMS